MNASDRAAIRWALRNQPTLLAEIEAELGPAWYEEQDRQQRADAARLAEYDAQTLVWNVCNHHDRTDWLDEQTCGCGAIVG